MPEDAIQLTEPLWTPTEEQVQASTLHKFQSQVEEHLGRRFDCYEDLWRWSATDITAFWASVWKFFGLDEATGHRISDPAQVLVNPAMPGAEWFPGAELNFASRLLAPGDADSVAIVATDESGAVTTLTRAELRTQVRCLAQNLRRLGVGSEDVVIGYLPNISETVVAFLATASLGAIWACVGQDYAPSAVVDRFAQLNPTVLVTADGYRFNGRVHDRGDAIETIRAGLSSLRDTIVIQHVGRGTRSDSHLSWAGLITDSPGADDFNAVSVPFGHPLWVLFSSGTTGLPKGLVHSHGGVLVQELSQLGLNYDIRSSDRFFWYTSPSWVMWNIQVCALALGASIVCFDGSPTFPDPSAMWALLSQLQVTVFGTSPGQLVASEKAAVHPRRDFDLSGLRVMDSTGAPLSEHSHHWAQREVGGIPLWSGSGGTDVAGGFCGGSPTVAVWPGEISVRLLGVAMDAWNDLGESVIGEVGELVVTRPMPSMPTRFWNDPDGSRYRDAYFSTFPGVWRHGDWITITDRGSVVIHGRSDSTLNRNGVRMGSADIYAALEALPDIADSLVVGVDEPGGGYWMPLFVVLTGARELDQDLQRRIRSAIRDNASPRHVPDEIIQVDGIPRTRTGKKLEVPIKRILRGEALSIAVSLDAVADAKLLDKFTALAADRARPTSVVSPGQL